MSTHEKFNYVEFAARDLPAIKTFFSAVFGWEFVDYGPEYTALSNQGLDGGFYQADMCSQTNNGAALVFYSADIQSTLQKIIANGGTIIKPLFDFPGGCRFHFAEPNGNEFAVWSEAKN